MEGYPGPGSISSPTRYMEGYPGPGSTSSPTRYMEGYPGPGSTSSPTRYMKGYLGPGSTSSPIRETREREVAPACLKQSQMGTQGIHVKRGPSLVGSTGSSCRYKIFLSCLAFFSRPSKKYSFPNHRLFHLICPHGTPSWAGSRASSPVS
jgi:hypothetical protein